MDSEDDMHDANDSADDDFYSGGEAGLAGSDDGDADYDFADHDSDDSAELLSHRQQVISGSRPWGWCVACVRVDLLLYGECRNWRAVNLGGGWQDVY